MQLLMSAIERHQLRWEGLSSARNFEKPSARCPSEPPTALRAGEQAILALFSISNAV
jgi:hypothetical protein